MGSGTRPPDTTYILIVRILMEGLVGGSSLHIIERVRFLPPLHFFWMITGTIGTWELSFVLGGLNSVNWPDPHKFLGF